MAQLITSAAKRKFYRQTFEIKKKGVSQYRHTLLINPEDMSIEEPHRANVQQTLGGAYLSLFGQGLHTVTISGKTGYSARKNAEGVITDGYEEIKNLRKRLYRDFISDSSNSQNEMIWYNWEDEEYYKVMPMSMRIQRSVSSPMMYRYEIQFVCLTPIGTKGLKKPEASNLLSSVKALEAGMSLADVSSQISETTAKM